MQETHKLSDNLAALKEKIETGLEELSNSKELYEFRSSYLEGKKSKISELMKEMRNPVSYTHLTLPTTERV